MAAVDVRRRGRSTRLAPHLRDPELVEVGEELHAQARPVDDELAAADHRLARRPAAVPGRGVLVVRERPAVAHGAQVVGEAPAGRVEVEVAQLRVASVPEAVDDERRHERERARRDDDRLVLDAEPHRELALEHVEAVDVVAVDVEVGAQAVRREPRPRRVDRLVVGEDLDTPLGRVADHLAAAGRDEDGPAHESAV